MIIRGQEIDLQIFKKVIECFKSSIWNFNKWKPTSALLDKSGIRSQYYGQKYNPSEWDLIENGWDHDHCEICSLALLDSDETIRQFGYTNEEGNWLCFECFRKIISEDYNENEFVCKEMVSINSGQVYLFISPMSSGVQLEISDNAKFGGVRLKKYLDIPRKILESGDQDYNTYVILLEDPNDIVKLEVNHIYKLTNE